MENPTRRHVLTTSLLGLLCACSDLEAMTRTSLESCSTSVASMNWDCFVERLEKAASQQHTFLWNTDGYVRRVSHLLRTLDLTDSFLTHWEHTYRDDHPGEPEFADLLKTENYQVSMVSFEAGEFIQHHDHPKMTGVLLCAVGELLATNYDLIESDEKTRTCLLRRSGEALLLPGTTSTLTDRVSNIHCVRAKRFTQVIDIFTPPYDDTRSTATRWYQLETHPIEQRPAVFRAHF